MNMCTFSRIALGILLSSAHTFAGDMTLRYEQTLQRILHGGPPTYTDALVLADAIPRHTRRFTEFSGDVSGRYMGALAAASEYSDRAFPELDRMATQLLPLQKEDGHFGDPFSTNDVTREDMALLWGNGRLLIGLLEYYRIQPSPAVLECARKLGDCFIRIAPRFNKEEVRKAFSDDQIAVGYICWTQIIEGLVELHRATNDHRYLRLAEQIVPLTQRHPRQHTHGFVTTLRGILDLYKTTRDDRWLKKVEAEWKGIIASGNLLPHGALTESFKPHNGRDEGCSEADWLRLALGLWAETRNTHYLEQAECTLFNEFSLNQFHTGDFGHRSITNNGIGCYAARAWWCCTFHGLRAFPDVFRAAFHSKEKALFYDLPVEGRGGCEGLTMRAESTLEKDAQITLMVEQTDGRDVALNIRQPAWSGPLKILLNQQPLATDTQNGYARVARPWKQGDMLSIQYTLLTRRIPHPYITRHMAVLHGPWFLGANAQQEATFFDEPNAKNIMRWPALDMDPPSRSGEGAPYTVPVAHLAFAYLPGGYPMQPQTVRLRPLAEQTALNDHTAWIFWFEWAP